MKYLMVILLLCVANQADAGELLFLGDFEHGVIPLTRQNATSPWYKSGNPPVVVTVPEPVRFGRYAMKSVLDRLNSPVYYRTEVVPDLDEDKLPKIGEEYWYGFSIYFPKEWVEDNVWEIVAQWHGRPDFDIGETWRNPIMAFHTEGANLRIVNKWDTQPNTQEANKKRGRKYDGDVVVWKGPIHKDQWTDWVVHVKWSYKDDGLLEIWKNGEQIVRRKGPNTFNDKEGPYFKMGIYKGWEDRKGLQGKVSRRIIYHDEVRFAGPCGSYKDVAPPGPRPASYPVR